VEVAPGEWLADDARFRGGGSEQDRVVEVKE